MKVIGETGLDLSSSSKQAVKRALYQCPEPVEEEWRVPLLGRLLQERRNCKQADGEYEHLTNLITMVCSSTFE